MPPSMADEEAASNKLKTRFGDWRLSPSLHLSCGVGVWSCAAAIVQRPWSSQTMTAACKERAEHETNKATTTHAASVRLPTASGHCLRVRSMVGRPSTNSADPAPRTAFQQGILYPASGHCQEAAENNFGNLTRFGGMAFLGGPVTALGCTLGFATLADRKNLNRRKQRERRKKRRKCSKTVSRLDFRPSFPSLPSVQNPVSQGTLLSPAGILKLRRIFKRG